MTNTGDPQEIKYARVLGEPSQLSHLDAKGIASDLSKALIYFLLQQSMGDTRWRCISNV